MDNYIGITAIVGDEGTGKTSMALTFPRPIRHFDIDVGGYRRAAWRLEDTTGIVTKSYPMPIQASKLMGQTTDASSRIHIPKKVEGMKDMWQEIVQDFVDACQDASVATIIIDSSTLLWNINHKTELEMIQERQLARHMKDKPGAPFSENDYRERLQPIEYGPANDRMRQLLHTARSFQKNLVLVHYPTDEYGTVPDGKGGMVEGKTGKIILDGFKETVKLVDLVVWTRITEQTLPGNVKEKYPVAKIAKCGISGMGLKAVGMEVVASYEAIINLRDMMRGGSSG